MRGWNYFLDFWGGSSGLGGSVYGLIFLGLGFILEFHRKQGKIQYRFSYWRFVLYIPWSYRLRRWLSKHRGETGNLNDSWKLEFYKTFH